MIAVFDTNIVIDALNGIADSDAEYQRYARVLISHITWMEVMAGCAMTRKECATSWRLASRSSRWTTLSPSWQYNCGAPTGCVCPMPSFGQLQKHMRQYSSHATPKISNQAKREYGFRIA